MKKIFALFLTIVLILIAGCSTNTPIEPAPTTEELICSSEWFVTDETYPLTTESTCATEPVIEITESTIESQVEKPTEAHTEPTKPPIINEPGVNAGFVEVDPNEVGPNGMTNREMLACVVYQEAGWNKSCDLCRFRVADIVLNRVSCPYFPDTVYGVLMQENQYGRYHWTGIVWSDNAKNDPEGVQRAYDTVDAIFNGEHSDVYGGYYVWQAEFEQGYNIIKHCGTYYGMHSH